MSDALALSVEEARRLIHAKAEVIVMGGRDTQLAERRGSIFRAGANATIIGDCLTTSGAKPADILAMVADQGLSIDKTIGT